MEIINEKQLDFSDVLLQPRRSKLASRKDADIQREYKFKWSGSTIKATGITNANMGTIGNFNVARHMMKMGLFSCLHKHHDVEDLVNFYRNYNSYGNTYDYRLCFLSIGLRDNGVEKVRQIKEKTGFLPSICIDVPNGYIPQVKHLVESLRSTYPDAIIMVGNVVTGDITIDLINAGADIVKVGIGNGAQCLTRRQTGCGRPQFSAIVECAEAAHHEGGMICSDGGIQTPGDIGKAFGAGADFVMIGSLYAGTDEAEGEVITKVFTSPERKQLNNIEYSSVYEEKKFKQFYGMSSTLAQEKFGNGKPSYRASEGRITLVPYVGSIDDVNEEFLGGLRSTMTYIGASRLKDIPKCAIFYKVNNQLNRMYESSTIGK